MRFCSAYIQESEVDQINERKFCIIVCEINFFMFFFSATVDVVSLLTATTTISLVGVVVFTLYTLKLNCILSRKKSALDYNVKTSDGKYETLQRSNASDTVGIDTATEYMEISAITS